MDHASARLMEYHTGRMDTIIILSPFTPEEKHETLQRSESIMHHKEQQMQASFYGEVAAAFKPFEEVLLFGPTSAKEELYNTIKANPDFGHIRFALKNADKLTEYQQYTFVREYFGPG